MKIIVLGTRGFPNIQGGIEKHCEELYPRLVKLGCEVTVISRAPYTHSTPYEYQGVSILPLGCPKHKFLETFVHTFSGVLKARQLKGDILHIHAIGPSLFVPLARLLGMKVVVTHHGPDYDRKKWNTFAKMVLKLGERWGVMFANEVIVISKVIAETIRQKFHREVAVIPNGVVVNQRVREDNVLKRFDLERGKYILTVGRFVPEKGFNELIESFQQFSSKNPNRWKLVIVGDCDHEDQFGRELKKKGSSIPDVVLTGFQTGQSLQELYSHAGLFVLPSFHEGLPIALLEALSYGASCLVSDIPANREVGFLDGARYFKSGDINVMTQKLEEFVDRPNSEYQRRKIIQRITDKYNWLEIAYKTCEVYEKVLAKKVILSVKPAAPSVLNKRLV